jgi:hypothetical protein
MCARLLCRHEAHAGGANSGCACIYRQGARFVRRFRGRAFPCKSRARVYLQARAVRWLSGRKRRFAKPLYGLKPVPRVRIPASPPSAFARPSCELRLRTPAPPPEISLQSATRIADPLSAFVRTPLVGPGALRFVWVSGGRPPLPRTCNSVDDGGDESRDTDVSFCGRE